MLREVSTAKMTSMPRRFTSSQRKPACGRASARKRQPMAARNNPRFQFRLAAENDAVSCACRCDDAKVASAAR